MRGDSWHTLIPLYLYLDEFETESALGRHAGINKFGALYTYIACLPPKIASQLSSIIFSDLICAKDKKECNNKDVFGSLIEDFNNLRTKDITIIVDQKPVKIYFQLVLLLSDNLGINKLLDMVCSFKDSACCRACRASADD